MNMIFAFSKFSLGRLMHNARYLIFVLGLPVGFYELYAHMYGTATPFAHTSWGVYFMMSMVAFGAVGTTLNVTGTQTALDRAGGWVRHLKVTPVPVWAYLAGQVVTAMVASLAVVMIIILVGLLSGGVSWRLPLAEAALAIWLGSLAYAALGLALAHWLDATLINYGIILVYLGSGMLGGLWTPLKYLPPVFTSIARAIPSYRMADMAWHLVAGRTLPGGDVAVLAAYVAGFGLLGGILYVRRN